MKVFFVFAFHLLLYFSIFKFLVEMCFFREIDLESRCIIQMEGKKTRITNLKVLWLLKLYGLQINSQTSLSLITIVQTSEADLGCY